MEQNVIVYRDRGALSAERCYLFLKGCDARLRGGVIGRRLVELLRGISGQIGNDAEGRYLVFDFAETPYVAINAPDAHDFGELGDLLFDLFLDLDTASRASS